MWLSVKGSIKARKDVCGAGLQQCFSKGSRVTEMLVPFAIVSIQSKKDWGNITEGWEDMTALNGFLTEGLQVTEMKTTFPVIDFQIMMTLGSR